MTPILRTRVKICGITRPADGVAAARLGADAIGLVFYPPSPRFVTVETVQQMGANAEVRDYEQRFATAVGLLLDSHGGDQPGGFGRGFDWARIPAENALLFQVA